MVDASLRASILGSLRKLQVDTYEREVERYGGPAAIDAVERIFQADSEAVLEILEMLEEGDEGADERWRLALAGIDILLEDFGFDPAGKRALLDRACAALVRERGLDESARRAIGERFRKESRSLERLLVPGRDEAGPLAPGIAVLRARSDRLAPLVAELKAVESAGRLTSPFSTIVLSLLHMHVNRMLCSMNRNSELVLYDFLARIYEARAARAKISRG